MRFGLRRFRFGLRTLLILILVAGAIAGYYGRKIRLLARERAGLIELSESWSGVRVRPSNSPAEPEPGLIKTWLDWPLRRFSKPTLGRPVFAHDPSRQVEWLRLYASETKPRSLDGIEKLSQLQTLKFLGSPGVGSRMILTVDEASRIGELKKLKTLRLTNCDIDADALAQLTTLELSSLVAGSKSWTEVELEQIAKIKTLQQLSLLHTPSELEPLADLQNLRKLSFRADQLTNIEPLTRLRSLTALGVAGRLKLDQVKTLQRIPNLEVLEMDWVQDWNLEFTKQLLQFPALREVQFGWNSITTECFDMLVDARIQVDHRGLKDFNPEEFLTYEGNKCEVDQEQSELIGTVQEGKQGVGWRIHVKATSRYCPTKYRPPDFESQMFFKVGDWRELPGMKAGSLKSNGEKNFRVYGKEHETYDNFIEVFSRDRNCFHLKWRFASMTEEGYGRGDANLCLRRVFVQSNNPISRQQAEIELAKQFDLADFENYVTSDSGQKLLRHEFRLVVPEK